MISVTLLIERPNVDISVYQIVNAANFETVDDALPVDFVYQRGEIHERPYDDAAE